MTDHKPTRREIMKPMQLVGIALVAGVFAGIVTMVSTGAFTDRVNRAIANGTYQGMPPITLGLVVAGGAFIVTLLGIALLMLAVDPADVVKRHDTPVLYDPETPDEPASGPLRNADGSEVDPTKPDAPTA
ncbi:hypothetical protein [Microbacterium bovistercoris]|uniref:hypothetical protein n=1 Tax=Microbacterium bovistercoris TaxID=2293570 RepID=UPI0015F260A4|nr:hypothetical protein [Microbacterium bovistercoris]